MENQDWNELSRNVAAVVKFIRPLLYMEKIPEAIEAAKSEEAKIRNEIAKLQQDADFYRKETEKVQKALNSMESEWTLSEKAMVKKFEDEKAQVLNKYNEEMRLIKQKVENEKKKFDDFMKSIEAKMDNKTQELVDIQDKIDSKVKELEEYQSAISKILNK